MNNKDKLTRGGILLVMLLAIIGYATGIFSTDRAFADLMGFGGTSAVSSVTEPVASSVVSVATEGDGSESVVDFGSSEVVEIFSETAEGSAPEETAGGDEASEVTEAVEEDETPAISEDGTYTSKDEVALYIHTYGRLPSNYITKSEAQKKGWDSSKGNLAKACPGMSIGGDKFGNREKLLPTKKGRQYYECDIDYVSGSRNGKRIVFSNDGLVYYTQDHYNSFELLYE